eukprot:1060841-Amphidinium_carterae.1
MIHVSVAVLLAFENMLVAQQVPANPHMMQDHNMDLVCKPTHGRRIKDPYHLCSVASLYTDF